MKISNIQAQLTSNDVLSIINEFVKVDGLNINKIDIYGSEIEIGGSFKKGVSFDFTGIITLEGVIDGIINARFSKLKLSKFGIFRFAKNFALKKAIQFLKVKGITVNKDRVSIDLQKILLDITYVDLKPSNLYIRNNIIHAEIEELEISILGNLIKNDVQKEQENEKAFKDSIEYPIDKVKDCYTVGRNKIEKRIPESLKNVKNLIFIIPDIVALIFRLIKDKRVALKTKLYLSAAVACITFPVDFIPDNIPIIGKIDDVAIAVFALNRIVNDVPIQIIAENWEGSIELLELLNKSLDYLIKFTNANNVEKLYNVIEELSTL